MGKKVIKYEFCDGTVSEVEVSDALFAVHERIDKRIENGERRETRRHNSLEQLAERRDTEIIDGRVDVETDYIKSEAKLLSMLSDNERELLESVYIDGKTMAEIAREKGVAHSTIKTKIYRILKKLKEFS